MAKPKRQMYYCRACVQKRLAVVEYFDDQIKVTCSQGHVDQRKRLFVGGQEIK